MNDRSVLVPAGACDTHIHFYDSRYPTSPAAHLHPPDASPEDYRAFQSHTGTERVVVVQPTTYGLDNTCQLEGMAQFGDTARGVMVIGAHTSEDELERLTGLGVRGARFHMLPGGAVPWDILDTVATRIAEFGWHVQLQLNGRDLAQHLDLLRGLPVDVVVDHVGRFMPPEGVDHPGFRALLALLDSGRAWVKLSAPYESSATGPPHYDDVTVLVDDLTSRFPDRLLWASNWPHPGQPDPPTPGLLTTLLERWLPGDVLRQQILVDNPAHVYGFS